MTFLGVAPGVLNAGKDLDRRLDNIAALGSDGVRALCQIDRIQPTPGGPIDFTPYMPIVDGCTKRGLTLSAGLGGRYGHAFDDPAGYAVTAAALARQIEGRCAWFETVNEPEHFVADANPTPARFVELHKRAYDSIKTSTPSVKVGNGGLGGMQADGTWPGAPAKPTCADFWAECYKLGIKGHLDVAMHHPYSQPGTFEESVAAGRGGASLLKQCRAISVANGDKTLPWVLTEFGWQTGGVRNPISQADQAARLADAYRWISRRSWIAGAFWFDDQDQPSADPNNTGDWMGLYDGAGHEKQSAAVFRALAALDDAA